MENALRLREMNMDEALDILSPMRSSNMDGWRTRHDDHYDHQPFPGQRFPTGPSTPMSFASVSIENVLQKNSCFASFVFVNL